MIKYKVLDEELEFETDSRLFSPQSIDRGTLAMLSVVEFEKNDKLLLTFYNYYTIMLS